MQERPGMAPLHNLCEQVLAGMLLGLIPTCSVHCDPPHRHSWLASCCAVYRINKGGTWFLACQWWDDDCRAQVYVQRASGQADLRWGP